MSMRDYCSAIGGLALVVGLTSMAHAECHFEPYAFFPDRNDTVNIAVTTDPHSFYAMAFREGPGYHFTSASFGKAPPHGVLAQKGPTSFLYIPFKDYRGPDIYSIKVCADVGSKHGCSTLIYNVDVQ
ncbi:MAG TPA: hypothetical protein VGG12_07430 [Methylovirgula sp.]|jgi:hypothetical protein